MNDKARFGMARVARLATVDSQGQPHLVPIVFALSPGTADTIYSAVDAKPKRSNALRRLANVAANPRVAVLADRYDEDWDSLWWVRADGIARVLEAGSPQGRTGIALLVVRYPQYRRNPPDGPVLAIDVTRWSSWSSSKLGPAG